MSAPIGSYVRNWWTGQVVELSDNTSCGTLIRIQSGNWQHIYCHLNGHVEKSDHGRYLIDPEGGIQLWEGQQVSVGARMARVGMTGRTTGPHLHWGLKYGDSYVDPALVLREMYRQNAAMPSPPHINAS
jgi:murein DD-endopeptidase MepM/ murein hydrolase activator NlpD